MNSRFHCCTFVSNSCAEGHWPVIERLIYDRIYDVEKDPAKAERFLDDYKFRMKMIRDYGHLVAAYFDKRSLVFLKTVATATLGIEDWLIRYEWAKGRGMIHSHAIYFSKALDDEITEIFAEVDAEQDRIHDAMEDGSMGDEEGAREIHDVMAQAALYVNRVAEKRLGMTSMYPCHTPNPKGAEEFGAPASQFVKPHGPREKRDTEPSEAGACPEGRKAAVKWFEGLRSGIKATLMGIMTREIPAGKSKEDVLDDDYRLVLDYCMIHKCSAGYCFAGDPQKKKTKHRSMFS